MFLFSANGHSKFRPWGYSEELSHLPNLSVSMYEQATCPLCQQRIPETEYSGREQTYVRSIAPILCSFCTTDISLVIGYRLHTHPLRKLNREGLRLADSTSPPSHHGPAEKQVLRLGRELLNQSILIGWTGIKMTKKKEPSTTRGRPIRLLPPKVVPIFHKAERWHSHTSSLRSDHMSYIMYPS